MEENHPIWSLYRLITGDICKSKQTFWDSSQFILSQTLGKAKPYHPSKHAYSHKPNHKHVLKPSAYKPAPSPAYKPAPTPAYRPAPTPAYKPAPAPAYKPAPVSAYKPYEAKPRPIFRDIISSDPHRLIDPLLDRWANPYSKREIEQ